MLPLAGATVSADQIAAAMSEVTAGSSGTPRVGSMGSLNRAAGFVAPQPDAAFPDGTVATPHLFRKVAIPGVCVA